MEFKVEAAVKKGKQQLSLSVKWEEPCEVVSPEEIRITSVEPELPPCEPKPSGTTLTEGKSPELVGGELGMNETKEVEKKANKQK
jgi:hypothetical protein